MTPLDKKQLFRDMQEHPENYTDEQLEAMMADIDRAPDTETAWQRLEEKMMNDELRMTNDEYNSPASHESNSYSSFVIRHSSFQKIAASFIAVLLITGVAFAAIRLLAPMKITEVPVPKEPEEKMLTAFFLPEDVGEFHKKHLGDGIVITWLKGTWIEGDDYSYIEERPVCQSPFLAHTSFTKVMLDGKELDINNLPDLPASALKKMEKHFKDGKWINLITTPVQIPADVKGNINPELTILLTGTPPADAKIKSSIYVKEGIHESFDWKQYQYTSWTSKVENISNYLEDVAIRKDHHVRVNVCRGVSQKHIDRLEKLMREKGVLKYDLVKQ